MKYAPQNPLLASAIDLDNAFETGKPVYLSDIEADGAPVGTTPVEPAAPAGSAAEGLAGEIPDEPAIAFLDQALGFGKKMVQGRVVSEYTWRELAAVDPGYIGYCLGNSRSLQGDANAWKRDELKELVEASKESQVDPHAEATEGVDEPASVETPSGRDAALETIDSAPGYYRSEEAVNRDGEPLYSLWTDNPATGLSVRLGTAVMTLEDVDFTARQHAKNAAAF
jgi:hypothetical protein